MYKTTKRHGQREALKDIPSGYFYRAEIGVPGRSGSRKNSQ